MKPNNNNQLVADTTVITTAFTIIKPYWLKYFFENRNMCTSASLWVENISDCFRQESKPSFCFDKSDRNFFDQICDRCPDYWSSMMLLFSRTSFGKTIWNSTHDNSARLKWFDGNFESKFSNFVQVLRQNSDRFRREFETDDVIEGTRNHLGLGRIVFWEKKQNNKKKSVLARLKDNFCLLINLLLHTTDSLAEQILSELVRIPRCLGI